MNKSTKKTLLFSILALILCVAMLASTTLAWFTDTASTAVNKIQAGTLDVALEMKDTSGNWVTAEGQILKWTKANGTELADSTEILWEPGCNYKLQDIRVMNKGNLALKYMIQITGIQGSAKLNEAIEWTITKGGNAVTGTTDEYFLLPANATGDTITISGHMKEDAGNEYQGQSIDGIAITVSATQYTAEFDSIDNQYDKDALYATLVSPVNQTETKTANVNESSATTDDIMLTSGPIPAGTTLYTDNSKTATLTNTALEGKLKENIKTTGNADSVTFDIGYQYVTTEGNTTDIHGFSNALTHKFNLSKGLKTVTVTHNDTAMTKNDNVNALEDGEFNYDAATGVLTIKSSTYSAYKVEYTYDFVAATGGQGYTTLEQAINEAKSGDTVTLLKDVTVSNRVKVEKSITLNLNGQTLKNDAGPVLWVSKGNVAVTGTGTISSNNGASGASAVWLGLGGDATLTIGKDATVSGSVEYGISLFGKAGYETNVIIDGNVITTGVGAAISGNGTYSPASITINNGANVSCTNGAGIYFPQAGTLTVNGGSISGTTAIEAKSGTINISGGTVKATGVVAHNPNGNGTSTSGYALAVVEHNSYSGNTVATVTGGNFTGSIAVEKDNETTKTGKITISGGTFSSDPSDYCANGYGVEEEGGKYTVIQKADLYIRTAEDLVAFANEVNVNKKSYSGQTVALLSDINLENVLWTPIGQTGATQFMGTFDGRNHTISNLKINNTDASAHCASGLFGWLNSATVKNLKVSGANVAGYHNVGVIAGYLETAGCTIENCHVTGATVSCTHANNDACGDKCGVIVGHAGNAGVSVKNCTAANSTVSAGRDAGQIVGAAPTANVTGCSATNVTVTAAGDCTGANINNEVIGRIL